MNPNIVTKTLSFILFFAATSIFKIQAQNATNMDDISYFADIQQTPESYEVGNVLSRFIAGLGFRFYHATDNLTEENYAFKPGEDARTIGETLDHIYRLSLIVRQSVYNEPFNSSLVNEVSPAEARILILKTLEDATEKAKTLTVSDLEKTKMTFENPDRPSRSFPFWNLLNGPIEDAVWHTGQVVMMRRMAGNPFNSKVSVLNGKVRD